MPQWKQNYEDYADGEMEQEFTELAFCHKIMVSWEALKEFADEGIFEHYLIKDKYDLTGDVEVDSEHICKTLYDKYRNEKDDRELTELYNYCWDKLCPLLEEDENFMEGR